MILIDIETVGEDGKVESEITINAGKIVSMANGKWKTDISTPFTKIITSTIVQQLTDYDENGEGIIKSVFYQFNAKGTREDIKKLIQETITI